MSEKTITLTDAKAVGERLRMVRKEKSLTQHVFAERLGVSQTRLSAYETGATEPPVGLLEQVALQFKANVSWLLTGEGDPWDTSSPADLEFQQLAEAISRLKPDQRQAVAEIVAQLLKTTETETKPEPAPKPEPPPAPTHTLRSGQVINIDEYRARLSEDAQGDLTDEEVAEIAQFEESCVRRGVQFHEFSLAEIFTSTAKRIRDLIDMGRQVDLC